MVGRSAEEDRVVAFNWCVLLLLLVYCVVEPYRLMRCCLAHHSESLRSGHVLGETELLQRALPALETQLTQGLSRPLHLITEMLSQEYREMVEADTSAAVACPACVTVHLTKVVAQQEARDG